MFKKVTVEEQIRDTRQGGLARTAMSKEDMDEVAITSAATLEDSMSMAETVGFLLMEVNQLKDKVDKLERSK